LGLLFPDPEAREKSWNVDAAAAHVDAAAPATIKFLRFILFYFPLSYLQQMLTACSNDTPMDSVDGRFLKMPSKAILHAQEDHLPENFYHPF
jgi:hypothetical protein